MVRQLFTRGVLVKLIGVVLLFVAVPLAEIFLFIYIGHLIGNFLVLIVAVLVSAAGALAVADQAGRSLARLATGEPRDRSAAPELGELAGILAAAVLLVTPGFITDLCGFVLLAPRVRAAVGRLIVRSMNPRLRQVFERLGLVQSLKIR